MRRLHVTVVLALLALPAALTAEGFSIGARAGTNGVGPELAFGLGPHLDLRVPVGIYSYDDVYDATGIRYDGTLTLRNALLLADIHPSSGGFRISAGGGWNDNRLEVSARSPSWCGATDPSSRRWCRRVPAPSTVRPPAARLCRTSASAGGAPRRAAAGE
jgi:hypothetical protein